MKRIVELDGVRALAVSIVILDHYAPFRNFAGSAPARFGGIGVDIFFVLSGFLITNILLKSKLEPHSYRVFYARRSIRILPPFFLLLLVVYVAGAALGEGFNLRTSVAQLFFLRSFKGTGLVLEHAIFALRHPLSTPGLFAYRAVATPPRDYGRLPMSASLGPTWSLSVEEWFYVLWAPVVLWFNRRRILVTGMALCGLGLFFRWVSLGSTNFLTSLDVLVVGALLALWTEHRETLSPARRALYDKRIALVSTLALGTWLVLTAVHRDLLSITLLEIVIFGFFCWLLRHSGASGAFRLLRARSLLFIGAISYSIYLLHLPVYFLVRHATDRLAGRLGEVPLMWLTALVSIVLTLAFATASWRLYEEPILRQKERMTQLLKRDHTQRVATVLAHSAEAGVAQ